MHTLQEKGPCGHSCIHPSASYHYTQSPPKSLRIASRWILCKHTGGTTCAGADGLKCTWCTHPPNWPSISVYLVVTTPAAFDAVRVDIGPDNVQTSSRQHAHNVTSVGTCLYSAPTRTFDVSTVGSVDTSCTTAVTYAASAVVRVVTSGTSVPCPSSASDATSLVTRPPNVPSPLSVYSVDSLGTWSASARTVCDNNKR